MIGIDADVWATYVVPMRSAGLTVLNYQVAAASAFARRAKANGYWSKLLYVNLLLGKTAAAVCYPIKAATGLNNPGLIVSASIVDADVHPTQGLRNRSAGATQAIDTGLNPSTYFSDSSSIMMGVHVGLPPLAATNTFIMGAYSPGTANPTCTILIDGTNVTNTLFLSGGVNGVLPATRTGLYCCNRKDVNTVRIYKDGAVLVGDTVAAATGRPNGNIYLGGTNLNAGIGSAQTVRSYGFYIGTGFTDADCAALGVDNAILQADLRRVS
jgi:hypothetical protein